MLPAEFKRVQENNLPLFFETCSSRDGEILFLPCAGNGVLKYNGNKWDFVPVKFSDRIVDEEKYNADGLYLKLRQQGTVEENETEDLCSFIKAIKRF